MTDAQPDQSDALATPTWEERLYRVMRQRQEAYDRATDASLKRNMAGGMLVTVVLFLRELPRFRNVESLMGLKDLLIFLDELDKGKSHPWLETDGVGGGNSLPSDVREVRAWVKSVGSLLLESGFTRTDAYDHIARGLTRSGRTNTKGGPISGSLVGKWCRAPIRKGAEPSEEAVRTRLKEWWSVSRTQPSHAHMSDTELAAGLSDSIWSEAFLRDQALA